ncbi:T9SS type A sorting domain-containing protein [Pontibacter russatus]|uniref:T9SS type A sorting domain-containing protein n=1 Tax=Pontibacter russatus TaxID=2694929 RepID=UPI001379489B|nr:T9SS type A sorting domain-containing protein [Pontibacter russatus]
MRKTLALLLLMLWFGAAAMAQAVLRPLQQEARAVQAYKPSLLRTAAVALPFFDDFAASSGSPDAARWLAEGGVYINNRYALAPVTINVASFDGLNALGQPYAPGSSSAGASDTLTSQPIQLGSLNPRDSLYLSFYWQSGGLGDVPDRTESNLRYLALEFKDRTGVWREVWRQAAVGEVTDFVQVFVGVKDPAFLHDAFQFRFRNVGLRNGLADVWNLDYIELYKNRRKGERITRDIGISQGVSKLLQHYTAMPARQFRASPEGALAEEVRTTVNNLGGLPGAISWRGYIRNVDEGAVSTFLRGQDLVPAVARQYEITGAPGLGGVAVPREGHFTLLHGIQLDTKEPDPLQRANDSTERKTVFADYYAYDDGTAEAGFSFVGTGNTQVAQRFDLSEPDQLRAFRVYFPRIGSRDLTNTPLSFRIWAGTDSVPGEVLHQQGFQIQYTDTLNEFYEVQLTKPVPVEGSFYMGWSQNGNTFVNIGFDRNEPMPGRRFIYTPSEGWEPETTLEGAVMMRPVLVGEALGIEDEVAAATLLVFPNPSSGEVYINEPYEHITVFDMTGKKVYSQPAQALAQPIILRHLAPGLYTLRIQTREAVVIKKLMLHKL